MGGEHAQRECAGRYELVEGWHQKRIDGAQGEKTKTATGRRNRNVNKRVSRLAANIPFMQRNLSPLSFVDVPQSDYLNAILGVYELNRVDYLRDVFECAYGRSCARYSAVRQSLGEPDPFRLRHRERLKEVVAAVVRQGMDKPAAAAFVRRESAMLPNLQDHPRFAEMAETELTSLHEGNFARYRLRPAEFATWQETWRQPGHFPLTS
jgi:hypothetical protein